VIDDAIGSLRTLFSASLAVLVLWLVTWPATGEKLALFAAAVELHEWVALKDRLGRLESSVFETSPGQAISGEAETAQRIAPNDELYDRPDTEIVVSTTWPERRSYTITLEPVIYDPKGLADRARAYQVTGRDLPLSWGQLYAVFRRVDPERDVEDPTALDEEPRAVELGLVPASYRGFKGPRPGERQVLAALRDANFPPSWEELRLPLLEHGFDGDASALTRDDAALAGLRGAVDVRKESAGISILGVQLSLSQLFAAIGLVLAIQAFLALGPLLALRAAEDRRASLAWIFALPRTDAPGRAALEGVICAVTFGWAAAPLGILVLQCVSYARLGSAPHWSFWPGALGLAASALVFAAVAVELRALRTARARRSRREPVAVRVEPGVSEPDPRAASLTPR
jgi:hypothetical protein